jgi:hypothetical protein
VQFFWSLLHVKWKFCSADAFVQFVSWMEGNGFSISEKLAIAHLKAGDGKLVRGVVVLKDIRRGETLCNLPVNSFSCTEV